MKLLILDGRLPLDHCLPSERRLAELLNVSRTTISAAFTELKAEGFLLSRQGSGTTTAHPGGTARRELQLLTRDGAPGIIDLSAATVSAGPQVHEAYAAALRGLPRYLPRHGYEHLGVGQLRRVIAQRYTARGLPTGEDQVLITAGAQNALALLLRALTRPGRAVMVEQPTYPHALHAIEAARCRIRPVPLVGGGWEQARMAAVLREPGVDLGYLIPDHQNPTGLVMPEEMRRGVLGDAEAGSAMVIFDETLTDLWFDRPPPSADLDHPRLIRTGSVAKSVWGGLRLGWIRATSEIIDKVVRARTALDLGVPVVEQLAGCHLLAGEEGLQARRDELRRKRDLLCKLIGDALPTWRFEPPRGGLALWVEIDGPVAAEYAARAESHGVRVAAGPRFGAGRALERHLRLAFSRSESELERAVTLLAAAYAETAAPDTRARSPRDSPAPL